MIFKHTSKERGMWRGWLKNGQSVEISVAKRGWDFGGGVHIHSDDDDRGSRMIFLRLWRLTIVLPIGILPGPYVVGDEPQWSVYASKEFGLTAHWGTRRWSTNWLSDFDWHRTSYLMADGSWVHELRSDRPAINKKSPFKDNYDHYQSIKEQRDAGEWKGSQPYRYVLKSGAIQQVSATITVREYEHRRRWLRWTKAFAKISKTIDVQFDGEVGEGAGSWKGGCVGCAWDLLPDEAPSDALRRMEREREFR